MKNFYPLLPAIFLLLNTMILSLFEGSAQNTGIIPTPQNVEYQQGVYSIPVNVKPNVVTQIIPSFPVDTNPEQGYILDVMSDKILIQATTETGLFYGRQSVKQLLRAHQSTTGFEIPCMHVVDYPLLPYRGWMDDISRGPIPNMTFLKSVIEKMAEYKMNFFNLYTEHVFKLDKFPDIAPTDGLTAAEIKELEQFAAQYHVEIFGNQQCLAHAEKTLRIPFYQDMADTKANYNPGVPKTYDFLKYELETVANAYQSPFFNIDCDETEALGNGKASGYVGEVGSASQVYAQHIQQVYNILTPLGKKVMMWGDIAAKDSLITAQLPKDMMMIVWSYAPSDNYEDMMKPFVQQGLEFMVAPGMSMWSTVFPSYRTYTKNIANLIRDGYRNGAKGVMNTAWDDSGESLFNSTWHGMAWAAEMAWKPLLSDGVERSDSERNARQSAFDDNFETQFLGYPVSDLFRLGFLEDVDIQGFFQSASLYDHVLDFYDSKVTDDCFQTNVNLAAKLDLMLNYYKKMYDGTVDTKPLYETALARIAHYVCLREQVVAMKNELRYMLYKLLQGEKNVTVQADNGCQHLNRTVSLTREGVQMEVDAILNKLHQTKNEYMILWDEECRPYSRDIVEKRFDAAAQELLDIPYHVFINSELNGKGEAVVSMKTLFEDTPIYYTTDGREPQIGENNYDAPVLVNRSSLIRAMTKNPMKESVYSERYVLIHTALQKISKVNSQIADYRPQYAAGGKMALADGMVGGLSYDDGRWQGFWGNDIDVEFDFGKTTTLSYFKTRFFQDVYDWIMSPNTVEIYTSKNGRDYVLNTTLTLEDLSYASSAKGIFTLQNSELKIKSRYVRVVVKNAGGLPSWHQAKGQPSYIFCDEIILN